MADQDDFARYFAARRDRVRRFAYLLCGDWHWADDLCQVAFVRLASAWHRVRDPAAIDAFVRTCLMRAYLSEARKVWRQRERTYAEPPDGIEDAAAEIDGRLDVMDALREVPPRQRATLVCRYYQGLDVEQTAALLGCSAGTVKSQTARGLATLRRLLGADALTGTMKDEVAL